MPPRRKQKRVEEDEEMDRAAEQKSKWAAVLSQEDSDEEEGAALYKKDKEIYEFDFSKEHRLHNQKETPKKEEPKVVLTPEEQAALEARLAKEKAEKEEKERIKKEKKQERKKKLDQEKQVERQKKEEEQKEEEQVQKLAKREKGNNDTKKIFTWLLAILLILGTLQYQKDIYVRLSRFRLDSETNHYETLQTSSGVSDSELKNQYKKLVMKYHPDKNPNCHTCTQKFDAIMKAWQVLGSPQKRKHYDQSSGYVTQIPSQTLTLTPDNYHHLLGDSDELWIVQVIDSTSEYCHYFAQFWEDTAMKYKDLVKFGRMDVWQQSEMKSYVPYKFQLFPGLYSVHRGEDALCQIDFQRPVRGIEKCIEARLSQSTVTKINDISQVKSEGKKALILGGGIKLTSQIKTIHLKYQRYYDIYHLNNRQSTVQVKDGGSFKYQQRSSSNIKRYDNFLAGHVVKTSSMCEVQELYRQKSCILLLEKGLSFNNTLTPVVEVKEWPQFQQKINYIKNMTGLMERFELGVYRDGKIDFGNFDELDLLNPDQGEVIEFNCVEQTWLRMIAKLVSPLFSKEEN